MREGEGMEGPETGRLRARPHAVAAGPPWPLPSGLHPLGQGGGRDGALSVPAGRPAGRLPLVVLLHGHGGSAARMLRRAGPLAEAALVVLPESLGATWDVLEGGYGPDIARLDSALARILAGWPVDPARLAIGGFSDGASYALSVALMNGDLFSHALAFSPGFAAPLGIEGRARIFISHGTEDPILPIDGCSRRLVPKLQHGGWPVRYREFEGGHELPEAVAREALGFLMDG